MAASSQFSVVSVRFTAYNAHLATKTKLGRLEGWISFKISKYSPEGNVVVTEGCPPPVLTALHQTLIDLNVSEKNEFSLETRSHLWYFIAPVFLLIFFVRFFFFFLAKGSQLSFGRRFSSYVSAHHSLHASASMIPVLE